MSRDEWSRLTPAQMRPYIEAWLQKQEREHNRLEVIDDMAARIAWATIAPHQPKGSQSRPEDWRVLVRKGDVQKKTLEEQSQEKERKLIEGARLAWAAVRRAAERKSKRGKNNG